MAQRAIQEESMRHAALPMVVLSVCASASTAGAQTLEEGHEATFHAMVEAINDRDLERLDALIADDVVRHSQATPEVEVRSLDDFKQFLRSDFAMVPDSRIDCPMVIAQGDLVASWCTYEGTQEGAMGPFPPSGRQMRLDFSGFLRFQDGQIAEMWVTWDNLAALSQLGHYPPPLEDDEG
jgi:steroid delta-isomerase-like uncharacterized protein